MSKIIEKWIVGNYPPETNMGWVDTSKGTPVNKVFNNGKWEMFKALAGVIENFTIEVSNWSSLADKSPYTRKATITVISKIGNETIVELLNNDAVLFANYGFAIGAINGLNIDIYAITTPSNNVTLKLNIL